MNQDVHVAKLEGVLIRRSGDVSFTTEVVSLTGIFIRLAKPPPVMTLVQLRFNLPGHPDGVVLLGSIARVESAIGVDVMGAAIEFFAKAGDAAKAWDRYLKSLGAPIQISSRQPAPGSEQWALRLRSAPLVRPSAGRKMSTPPGRSMTTLGARGRSSPLPAVRSTPRLSLPPRR
jgi:hypothetical protein